MKETWKSILEPDCADGYEISNLGNVRIKGYSFFDKNGVAYTKVPKICKTSQDASQRTRFCIKTNLGKSTNKALDVFVAKYFVENPNNYSVVDHKDGDLTNNIADNLEWITAVNNPKFNTVKSLLGEIWKPLEECPIYYISSLGRIKSVARDVKSKNSSIFVAVEEILLNPTQEDSGYLSVGLSINSKIKTIRVHRLVAQTFLENPNNYPIVDHIDRNRINNSVSNLRWCTESQNATNGGTTAVIVTFPDGHTEEYPSVIEASKATGYRPGSITTHCSRRSCSKNGYKFRWVNAQSHIGQQNKRKGNDFERKVVNDLKSLGYNVVTSRSESKRKDDDKIDIVDLDNNLPVNIQTKYTSAIPNYFNIADLCSDKTKPFTILWKKSITGKNSPGAIAMIPLEYFYKLIKIKE